MASDESTLTVGPLDTLTGGSGLPLVPALTIVLHPHLDRIGQIAPLTNLLELDVAHVSRSEPIFFPPRCRRRRGRFATVSSARTPSSTSSSLTRGAFELRRVQDYQGRGRRSRPQTAPGAPRPLICSADSSSPSRSASFFAFTPYTFRLRPIPCARAPGHTSDAIEDVRRAVHAARYSRQSGSSPEVRVGTGKELAAKALHAARASAPSTPSSP